MQKQIRIKVSDDNQSAINAAIIAVEGKATVRTCDVGDCKRLAQKAEEFLTTLGHLTKTQLQGAKAHYYYAESKASSYSYGSATTKIYIERGSKDWFFVGAERIMTYPNQSTRYHVDLSKEQIEFAKINFEMKLSKLNF